MKDKFVQKMKQAEFAIEVGSLILEELRKDDPELYERVMADPINSCSCGYISAGDYTPCPKCEDVEQPKRPGSGKK